MALALSNPVRGKSNLIARAIYRDMVGGKTRSNPRRTSAPWGYETPRADKAAIQAAAKKGVAAWMKQKDKPAGSRTGIFKKMAKGQRGEHLAQAISGSEKGKNPDLLAAIHSAVNTEMKKVYGGSKGFIKRQYGAKGGRYKVGAKRVRVTHTKNGLALGEMSPTGNRRPAPYWGRDVNGVLSYNEKRLAMRREMANFDVSNTTTGKGSWKNTPIGYWTENGPGVSGAILLREGAVKKGTRYSKKRKVKAKSSKKVGSSSYGGTLASLKKSAEWKNASKAKKAAFNSQYSIERESGYSVQEAIGLAWGGAARNNRGYGALALDNRGYGALALDNYGALALDNPMPFVGGMAADAGKLVLVGLAGALGHAFVADKIEEILPKIPVIGDKLLDLTVPEMVPVIGGMALENTVTGAIAGIGLIAISQMLGSKLNQPMIATYGSALGTGIIMAGPILDYTGANSGDSMDDGMGDEADLANLNGLTLEEYGALALDNEGTFGDGMAYQIGSIVGDDSGDDYGQASLGDAYYSGADFDLGEGQALVNGRQTFHKRFGRPATRVHRMGGSRGSASHLAAKPGHRWGWLIKMIGWSNVQKLATMPPQQRVSTIKQLRSNALETFGKLQAEAVQVSAAASPELMPVTADGADGVAGAHGAYGATVFGGAGL